MVGAVEIGNIGITVFARCTDAQLLPSSDVGVKCLLLRWSQRDRLDGTVGTYAHVVGPTNIDGMNQVLHNVFARGHSWRCHQVRHQVNAEVSVMVLSLIHISEPTRRTPISYAVFC